jgi:polyhydroxyalkanoate synthesis regulator phasin
MRGFIKVESEPTEIKIAGASIADLLKQHEQRLAFLESNNRLENRIAALEEKLETVDRRAWEGIWAQDQPLHELEERVAALERTLKPTEG